jgi:hypothetical protein
MKKHTIKSGSAISASPQPQQITPAKVQPTPEQIEAALSFVVTDQIGLFTRRLAVARGMWRKNRRLIESKTFPEPYWTLCMKANKGKAPVDQESEKAPTVEQLRKDPELLAVARNLATNWEKRLRPEAVNLVNEHGAVADPPTTTYRLLAQRFEDGKEIEFLQEVELTYDENWKLRRYLAELRGLIPAKDAA